MGGEGSLGFGVQTVESLLVGEARQWNAQFRQCAWPRGTVPGVAARRGSDKLGGAVRLPEVEVDEAGHCAPPVHRAGQHSVIPDATGVVGRGDRHGAFPGHEIGEDEIIFRDGEQLLPGEIAAV